MEKSKKHEAFKTELDSLYSRIFDGPSECEFGMRSTYPQYIFFQLPGILNTFHLPLAFPEEDRLEYDAHAADKQYQQAQTLLNTESQAAELLSRAVTHMERCQVNVREALSYSEFGTHCFIRIGGWALESKYTPFFLSRYVVKWLVRDSISRRLK